MNPVIFDCLPLAQKHPGTREKHLGRLCHAAYKGYLLCLIEEGKVIGYAELYKVKDALKHPVMELPETEENGRMLWVSALTVEDGKPYAIKKMKQIGKRIFGDCESIAFRARKKNYRLYQERWI